MQYQPDPATTASSTTTLRYWWRRHCDLQHSGDYLSISDPNCSECKVFEEAVTKAKHELQPGDMGLPIGTEASPVLIRPSGFGSGFKLG
jgi:hypothetical protein